MPRDKIFMREAGDGHTVEVDCGEWTTKGFRGAVPVTITIDLSALVARLLRVARRSRDGRAARVHGAVVLDTRSPLKRLNRPTP